MSTTSKENANAVASNVNATSANAAAKETKRGMRRIIAEDSWVRPFFFQYRKVLLYSLGLGVATMVFASALMFTSGYLISISAEHPELGVYALFSTLGFVQIFGIGKPFLGYFERLNSHDWVLNMTSKLRKRLYQSIESEGMFWTATHRAGDALGLLAEDIGHIQNLYLRSVFPMIIACVLWLLVSLVFGFFQPLFGLGMLLLVGVLIFLLPAVSVLANGARQARTKACINELYVTAFDNTIGLADWTFAQRGDEYVSRIMDVSDRMTECDIEAGKFNRKRDLAAQVLYGITAVVILVWAALQFAAVAQAGPEVGAVGRPADWLAAFVLGFFPLIEAFAPLSNGMVEMSSHLDSVERLNEMPDPVETAPTSAAASAEGKAGNHVAESGKGGDLPDTVSGGLSIRDLTFAYVLSPRSEASAESEPIVHQVVRGITLDVEPGQHIAILGPSGCGKSTLLSLIRGDLEPASGSVTLDSFPTCAFGDDISKHVSVIQQESYLFNKTLLENLRVGNPDATPEEAIEALERVGLRYLIDRLPKGIDTLVDESGLRFSGGERHRIALARVLLANAPIVLLDEPTVSLDPVTEAKLLATLFDVLRDRTIIMVTHHLMGIEHMDHVVFLDHGTIAMEGTPAELERTSQRYQNLLAFDRGL